ncbi:MAG: slipin family protein [Patescibacteria group bacterium]|nr:slipin family protein [Patescibacteria group bacterium]
MDIILWGILVAVIFVVLSGLRVVNQYERGVILTLGKYTGTRQPGLNWILSVFGIQKMIKVDLRVRTVDVPQQEAITKDNVPVGINAVVYFQIEKAEDAVLKIQDYTFAVAQYAQASLRDVIGGVELDSLLAERDKLADEIKKILDGQTDGWGINVTAVKMQDIELPADMKRAMAKQAEAERERRATIIRAEGELKASENLRLAATNLAIPGAISLRTLQTIEGSTANPASTVIFAVPVEIFEGIKKVSDLVKGNK